MTGVCLLLFLPCPAPATVVAKGFRLRAATASALRRKATALTPQSRHLCGAKPTTFQRNADGYSERARSHEIGLSCAMHFPLLSPFGCLSHACYPNER